MRDNDRERQAERGIDRNGAELLQVAERAARRAGEILLARLGRLERVEFKGVNDLVTDADRESERAIAGVIGEAFPEDVFLGEESGETGGDADNGAREDRACYRWVVDPLDGTMNYAHGLHLFSVSIACEYHAEIVAGVIFNPVSGELFAASLGGGAFLNGETIHVSSTERLADSLLATGFPNVMREGAGDNMDHFQNFSRRAQGLRRLGSAALHLAFVACGRVDGYWEIKLHPWDVAAGSLILTEAGGAITDLRGGPFRMDSRRMVASNGRIHREMLAVLSLGRTD